MNPLRPWTSDGWVGVAAVDEPQAQRWLDVAASGVGRRSRHARCVPVEGVFVKAYPAPAGDKATHAWRVGDALRAAGFVVPVVLLVATKETAGLLVTADVGGTDLLSHLATLCASTRRGARRQLLRALGAEVARLHAAGFVHGDLVPSNIQVVGAGFVFLDHDRTRQSRLLVQVAARRNLVQLGRFVVPGVSMTDRWRVLVTYAAARGWSSRRRKRVARWLAAKIIARRCRIDQIAVVDATRAGFRRVMQSGGPFDACGRSVLR